MVTFEAHKKKAEIERLKRKADVPRLIELLSHQEQMVRFQTVWALGQLRDERAYPHMVRMLRDPVPEVVRWAVTSLAEFGDPRAVAPMVEALTRHRSTWLSSRVEHAIRRLGVEACLPFILALLEEPRTRDQAAKRLVDIGTPALEPMMALRSRDDPELTKIIIKVLGQMGDAEALACLQQMRQSQASPGLEAAIKAIENSVSLINAEQVEEARQLEEQGAHEQAASIYENLGMGDEAQRLRAMPIRVRGDLPASRVSANFFAASGRGGEE